MTSRWRSDGLPPRPLCALMLGAALHLASFDLWRQPIFTDISFFTYFAAQIADGAVPYRDFFEHKAPLALFVGAWLYRAGDVAGIDPLYAIRIGYLAIATAAATTLAVTMIRINNNRVAAGWIGLLVFSGFPLLGLLPATGNVPKLIGLTLAALAILCVRARRWVAAGACATCAAMDWQPCGVLVAVAILLAGLAAPNRLRSTTGAIAGMVVAAVPFVTYLAARGALEPFLRLAIVDSLHKVGADPVTFGERWRTIWWFIDRYGIEAPWLVWAAGCGMVLVAATLVRPGRIDKPLVVALATYHFGIVLFSLADFQGRGDLLILQGSLALFAAVTVTTAYYELRYRIAVRRVRSSRPLVALVTFAVLLVLLQPSFLRRGWRVNQPPIGPVRVTLEAQRQVATRFSALIGNGRVTVLDKQEALFLGGVTNALDFVYWNLATYVHSRRAGEQELDTLVRLLRSQELDAIVLPDWWPAGIMVSPFGLWLRNHYTPARITSDNNEYDLTVWIRRNGPRPEIRGIRYVDTAGPGA